MRGARDFRIKGLTAVVAIPNYTFPPMASIGRYTMGQNIKKACNIYKNMYSIVKVMSYRGIMKNLSEIVSILKANKAVVGVITVAIVVAAGLISPSVVAANGAVTVNRGACMSYLAQNALDLVKYQAPGHTGNGPLIIVNGNVSFPPAFDGGVGCER